MDNLSVYSYPESNFDYFSLPIEELPQAKKKAKKEAKKKQETKTIKLSEMMAARKAARKEQAVKKYARDNIGNQRADRNKLANIAVIQVQNKLSLRSGAPQDLDSKLTENIKNLMHYQALVYENDRTSVTVFEKLVRAMRVVACIYSDNDLSKTTNEA